MRQSESPGDRAPKGSAPHLCKPSAFAIPTGYVQEQLGHANMSTTLKYYHQYIQVPRGARYQAMLARLQEVMATGRHCDLLDFGESESVSSANGFGPGTNPVVEGKFSTQTVTGTVTEPGEEGIREDSRAPLSALDSIGEPCRNRTYNLLNKSELQAYTGGHSEALNGRLARLSGRPSLFLVSLSVGQFATNTATRMPGCGVPGLPAARVGMPDADVQKAWIIQSRLSEQQRG